MGVGSAIAAIGIAERYEEVHDYEQALAVVAKRSVYSNEELEILVQKPGLKALTFLFYGYLKQPVTRADLERLDMISGPPQSFVSLHGRRLEALQRTVSGNLEAA